MLPPILPATQRSPSLAHLHSCAMSATWSTTPWGKPGAEATTMAVLRVMCFLTVAADSLKSLPTGTCEEAGKRQAGSQCRYTLAGWCVHGQVPVQAVAAARHRGSVLAACCSNSMHGVSA